MENTGNFLNILTWSLILLVFSLIPNGRFVPRWTHYDAARTLAAFSQTMRHEMNLNQLREDLLAVVQETMQPSHVSLWLRGPNASKGRNTRLLPEIDEDM